LVRSKTMAFSLTRRTAVATLTALLLAAGLVPRANAGSWRTPRVLEGPIAVSSVPDAPLVVENSLGHALAVWSVASGARYADKAPNKNWGTARKVPGGQQSAGFIAAALTDNDFAVIAFFTVATRYTPSKLIVSTRLGNAAFSQPVAVTTDVLAWGLRAAAVPDGSVTLAWSEGGAIKAAHLDAGTGIWDIAVLSTPGVPAWLPDLVGNEQGDALVAWQEGTGYQPVAIHAAQRAAGGDWAAAERVSPANGHSTWNAKPGLSAAGDAAVGWLDGNTMVVSRKPANGSWQLPESLSGSQSAYYPALVMDAGGNLVAAWQALDGSNVGSIWSSRSAAEGGWTAAIRLSKAAEDAAWPSAASARAGGLSVVSWTDNATNSVRASASKSGGGWKARTLGTGYWSGVVPVAAGGGNAVAGWATPHAYNPNAADLMADTLR
jgi:hypothetical protein